MATSPIHSLPPELLQKVWSFLPFFDLLRCQRVCKGWNKFLPGDDQVLHRATFSPGTVATSPYAEWDVYIDFRQQHEAQNGALPRLIFSLDVTTSARGRADRWRKLPGGKLIKDETHHPILKDTHAFVKLIHPEFSRSGNVIDPFQLTDEDHEWQGTEKNHVLENDNGVTVGDFVQVLRQELKNAATELTNYGARLTRIELYN